jgi:uncharacterized membrane protein YdjX (TVP38/TMEM64 family)
MKRYWLATAVVMCIFLALFLLSGQIEALNWLQNPIPAYASAHKATAAAASISLLITDVFLPVPGSLIMVGNGAIFGTAVGTAVSLTGGVFATLLGYYFGAKGKKYFLKITGDAEAQKAAEFLEEYGIWALVISRPVPIVSETVAILTGIAGVSVGKVLRYALIGYLPSAYIYALTGAYAAEIGEWVSFAIAVVIAGTYWFLGKRMLRSQKSTASEESILKK